MANIPMEDIEKIWETMGETKNWDHLKQVLAEDQTHSIGLGGGLAPLIIKQMPKLIQKPFPDNPEDLHEMINQEIINVDVPPEDEI